MISLRAVIQIKKLLFGAYTRKENSTIRNRKLSLYHLANLGWIGRRGPIEWPPKSPDITPMDFSYVWEHLKEVEYSRKHNSLKEVKAAIEAAL